MTKKANTRTSLGVEKNETKKATQEQGWNQPSPVGIFELMNQLGTK
jgi:hypothetical protein